MVAMDHINTSSLMPVSLEACCLECYRETLNNRETGTRLNTRSYKIVAMTAFLHKSGALLVGYLYTYPFLDGFTL